MKGNGRELEISQLEESIENTRKLIRKYEGDCPSDQEDFYSAKAARFRIQLADQEQRLYDLLHPDRRPPPPPPPPEKKGCLGSLADLFLSLLGCGILVVIAVMVLGAISKFS